MKKQLKDYVPFYIGQRILSYWGEIEERETILGIVEDKVILQIDDDNIESSIDLSFKPKKGKEPKLILRPLTAIDKKEGEYIVSNYNFKGVDMPMDKTKFAIEISKRISEHTPLMLWLIAQGFDVFGLIDCGLAIEP